LQKEELLHLHTLMVHIKKYYESVSGEEIETQLYNSLAISPFHIHKESNAHKTALLTLGDEIVSHIHHRHLPALPVVNNSSATTSKEVTVEQ